MAESCFVAIPFDSLFRQYYEKIYMPAITECDLDAVRADEIFTTGAFMRQVVQGIVSSTIVLADLTGRNANVFYEVGLAHAYRKPVVMLTQNPGDVPADLQGLRWIEYHTASVDWARDLRHMIRDMIQSYQRANATERLREFLPSAVVAPHYLARVADRIVDLSPTQRALFDFVTKASQPVEQRAIESAFADRTRSELFYRLETLRLLGLLESHVVQGTGTATPVYVYKLSSEAAAYVFER